MARAYRPGPLQCARANEGGGRRRTIVLRGHRNGCHHRHHRGTRVQGDDARGRGEQALTPGGETARVFQFLCALAVLSPRPPARTRVPRSLTCDQPRNTFVVYTRSNSYVCGCVNVDAESQRCVRWPSSCEHDNRRMMHAPVSLDSPRLVASWPVFVQP